MTKGERRGADIRNVKWVVVLGGGHTSVPRLPAASKISKASLARLVEGIRQRTSVFALRATPGQGGQRSEGRGQRTEFRIADFGLRISKKAENRDFPVGVAFSHDLAISTASTVSTIHCLPFTVHRSPLTVHHLPFMNFQLTIRPIDDLTT